MPTVNDLWNRLNYMVDDNIPIDEAIILFNEGQEEIVKDAAYAVTAYAYFNSGTATVPLPADLVEIVEVKMQLPSWAASANANAGDDGYRRLFDVNLRTDGDTANDQWYMGGINGYEWFGNNITIRPTPQESGTLMLKYYAMLPALTSNADANGNYTDVPAFRPQYHKILAVYAAMRWAQNWKDVPNEVQEFQQEFNTIRAEMQEDSQWRKERTKSRTVYQVREWR